MAIVTRAEVISIKNYGEDIKEFIIKPEKYRKFDAGTFLQLSLENADASDYWPESRTFSIASYYNESKTMRLIIKKVGIITTKLFDEIKEGSNITIKYSYGDFILPSFDNENPIICIAGGTGIAPFISFLECLEKEGGLDRMELYYSSRKKEEFFSLEYIQNILPENRRKLFLTREIKDGFINKRITIDDIKINKKAHYYICGSQEFINYFKVELKRKEIENIYVDEWE